MANRNYKVALAAGTGYVMMDGYATIGDSVGTIGSQFIDMATIARVGVGQYTVTLDDTYQHIKQFLVTACLPNTTSDYTFQVDSFAPSATQIKTITFRCKTGAVATELPANCGLIISIVMKKSSLGQGR